MEGEVADRGSARPDETRQRGFEEDVLEGWNLAKGGETATWLSVQFRGQTA